MCIHNADLIPCQPCALAAKMAQEAFGDCPQHPGVPNAKYHNECAACVKARAKGPRENMALDMKAINANAAHAKKQPPADPKHQQVGGSHYLELGIQPFDVGMLANLNALEFTIIKYIMRRKKDSRAQDLQKAMHTLERLIQWEQDHE